MHSISNYLCWKEYRVDERKLRTRIYIIDIPHARACSVISMPYLFVAISPVSVYLRTHSNVITRCCDVNTHVYIIVCRMCAQVHFPSMQAVSVLSFRKKKMEYTKCAQKKYYEIACARRVIARNAHTATQTTEIETIEFSFIYDIY